MDMDTDNLPTLSVRLTRDPQVEAVVLNLIQQRQEQEQKGRPQKRKDSPVEQHQPHKKSPKPSPSLVTMPTATSTASCFICGDTNIASFRLAPRRYQKQVELYKQFIFVPSFRSSLAPQMCSDVEGNQQNHSCSSCLTAIREVWDLKQQILSLEQDIEQVVKKARETLKLRGRGVGEEFKSEKVVHDFDGNNSTDFFVIDHDDFNIDTDADIGVSGDSINLEDLDVVVSPLENDPEPEIAPTPRPVRAARSKAKKYFKHIVIKPNSKSDDKDEDYYVEDGGSPSDEESDDEKSDSSGEDEAPIASDPKPRRKPAPKNTSSASGKKKREETDRKRNFACDCGKRFLEQKHLTRHINTVHGHAPNSNTEEFKCPKCTKICASQSGLLVHKVIVCKLEVNKEELDRYGVSFFDCDECTSKFCSTQDLQIHKSNGIHTGQESSWSLTYNRHERYKCSSCSKVFRSRKNFAEHKKTHKSTDEPTTPADKPKKPTRNVPKTRNFTCSTCGVSFFQNCELNRHIRRVHEKTEKEDLVCDLCGKLFNGKIELSKHQKRVHERQKKFQCDICGWKFFAKKEMQRHKNTHTKPVYPCLKCKREFDRQFYLDKHNKSFPNCDLNKDPRQKSNWENREKDKARRREKCIPCNVQTDTFKQMNKHIRDVHPELWNYDEAIYGRRMDLKEARTKDGLLGSEIIMKVKDLPKVVPSEIGDDSDSEDSLDSDPLSEGEANEDSILP